MTDEMLIAKAREQADRTGKLTRKGLDLANFPKIRVRKAMIVYFENEDEQAGHVEVCLDQETGEFIRGGYRPYFGPT